MSPHKGAPPHSKLEEINYHHRAEIEKLPPPRPKSKRGNESKEESSNIASNQRCCRVSFSRDILNKLRKEKIGPKSRPKTAPFTKISCGNQWANC